MSSPTTVERRRPALLRKALAVGLVVPLSCVALTIGAGASAKHALSAKVKQFPGTITIAFPTTTAPQFYPLLLAKDDGIFTKYGLNVNVETLGSATITAAEESGDVQFDISSPPTNEFGYQAGVPIKLIGMYGEHTDTYFLARSGISSVQGLVGHTVGVTSPTAYSSIIAKYALHQAGVPFSAVNFVTWNGAIPGNVAILAGEFDAADVSLPQVTELEHQLPGSRPIENFIHVLWPSGDIWGYSPWMKANKAATVAVLKALNDAVVTWNSNKALADQEIIKYTNTTAPVTIAQDYASTEVEFNHGSVAIHMPSTLIQSFINKILRYVGFAKAVNSYAEKGNEWTPTYYNAAFGTK